MTKSRREILVDEIAALVREVPGDLTPSQDVQIARKIVQHFSGSQVYYPKAPAEGKAFGLGTALAAGVPLAQARVEVGVSERHARRLLGRRWLIR